MPVEPGKRSEGRDLRWARNQVKKWEGERLLCSDTGKIVNGAAVTLTTLERIEVQRVRFERYKRALALIAAHNLSK